MATARKPFRGGRLPPAGHGGIVGGAFRTAAVLPIVAVAAVSAMAQDYDVTETSGQYLTVPSNATVLTFDNGTPVSVTAAKTGARIVLNNTVRAEDDGFSEVDLPFPFAYYGFTYGSIAVCTNGFALFNTADVHHPHAFNQALSQVDPFTDGKCAPLWDDLDLSFAGRVVTFTTGTAPNRTFVVCWEDVEEWYPLPGLLTVPTTYLPNSTSCSFQLQLSESSNRIVFAYADAGTWPSVDWVGVAAAIVLMYNGDTSIGIEAVTRHETDLDARYIEPPGTSNPTNTGHPAADYQFDPVVRTYTGTVHYDRVVVDASGIRSTLEADVPLADATVALVYGSTQQCSPLETTTNAQGEFTLTGYALDGQVSDAQLVVKAQSKACVVTNSAGGVPCSLALATDVSFAEDVAFGTLTIDDGNDPDRSVRAALNVAAAAREVHAWSSPRTADAIPRLEIVIHDAPWTTYMPAQTGDIVTSAQMYVSGASSNPDVWDSAVVRKVYARHVLASIAGMSSNGTDARFDAITDAQNAFAEGFGYYLNAVVTGTHQVIDGISSNSASVYELEDPAAESGKGADVAAWVAACLYDLTDGANEAWDAIDGTGTAAELPFHVVDALTGPVTGARFCQGWYDAGHATRESSVLFIHYRLAADDGDEPDDAAATAAVSQKFGFRRSHRVLNLLNDDWLRFTLTEAADSVVVDVAHDRTSPAVAVSLEVQDLAGAVLARGAYVGDAGPMHATTGRLPAGSYRLRISNSGDAPVADYTVQAFVPLAMSGAAFRAWTVNRPYSVDVPLTGGIDPYELTVAGSTSLNPPGLTLDGEDRRASGTPNTAGTFVFVLSAVDDGAPQHSADTIQTLIINPELEMHVGEFVAFAQGRPAGRRCPYTGGTAPYTLSTSAGALPPGIAVEPGEICFTGAATAAGSSPMKLSANDVAGSLSEADTTGVVCVPFGATPLAAGASACGYWFDAVQGSTVSIAVTTAKRQPKRLLRVAMIGSDGTTEIPVAAKLWPGKAKVSRFVAPASGRYYLIVASNDGDASQLVAKGRIVPPKSGAGESGEEEFAPGSELTVEIGALAGANLSFTARPDRSGLQLSVLRVVDPTGAAAPPDDGAVVEGKRAVTLKMELAVSGTWKVVLGAKPGTAGRFTYRYELKEPRKVAYSAD
jgi:hypothetical protein